MVALHGETADRARHRLCGVQSDRRPDSDTLQVAAGFQACAHISIVQPDSTAAGSTDINGNEDGTHSDHMTGHWLVTSRAEERPHRSLLDLSGNRSKPPPRVDLLLVT